MDYFLNTIDREPFYVEDKKEYSEYLGNPNIPALWSDNRDRILSRLKNEFPNITIDEKHLPGN